MSDSITGLYDHIAEQTAFQLGQSQERAALALGMELGRLSGGTPSPRP